MSNETQKAGEPLPFVINPTYSSYKTVIILYFGGYS